MSIVSYIMEWFN